MSFVLSLIFFFIFCLPGIPLGIWLCGKNIKSQPEGVFYGLLLGHLISTSLTVALVYFFSFSWLTLIFYILLSMGGILVSFWRLDLTQGKKVPLRPWGRGDYLILLASLLVFLVLAAPPQLNMGRETPRGYAFHASFASDSPRNMAVIAELAKGEIPPQNPYFSGEKLHYYWLSFVAPAVIYKILGKEVPLQDLLTGYTLFAGAFFLTIFFSALRLYTQKIFLLGIGMLLILLAPNYKGFYLWWTFPGNTGDFFDQVLHYKIEASTLRIWRVAIMGLYRYFLVAPQHLFALSFFLMAWTIYLSPILISMDRYKLATRYKSWVSEFPGVHVLVSFIMGALFGYSSFVGLIALLWYGGCLFIPILIYKDTLKRNLKGFLVAMGTLSIPLLVFYSLEKVIPGGTVVNFDINETFLSDPFRIFFLNLGPGFVLGTLGILVAIWTYKARLLSNHWLMGICLLLFSTLTVRNFWQITLKSSMIMVIGLGFFSVVFLDTLYTRFRKAWIVFLLIAFLCLPAIPTALLDAYVYTRSTSPSNTWFVSPEDMKALIWIRDNLPENSLVQDAPRGYGREDSHVYYSKIPSFAHRRVALGDNLNTMDFQILEERALHRKGEIDTFFKTHDLARAVEIAHHLGIEYVYIGPTERELYPLGLSKFDDFKNLFRRVYHQDRVSIFQILDEEPALITLYPIPLEKTSYQINETVSAQAVLRNQNYNHPIQIELALRLSITSDPSSVLTINEQQPMNDKQQVRIVTLNPGEEKTITLVTQTPKNPGTYQLEIVGEILLEGESRVERVSFQSEDLPSTTGQIVPDPEDSTGISRIGSYGRHRGGFLTYGPYIELPAGEYLTLFRLKGKDFEPGKRIATLDIAINKGRGVLAVDELFSEDFTKSGVFREFELPFILNKPDEVEFRTHFHGQYGELFVDKITVLVPKNLSKQNLVVFRRLNPLIQVN